MEIKAVLTDNELVITDKYGTSLILSKYVQINSKGEHVERLEMYPLNSDELGDRDDYTIDVPISEFDGVIDVIKDRFGLKTKEIKK